MRGRRAMARNRADSARVAARDAAGLAAAADQWSRAMPAGSCGSAPAAMAIGLAYHPDLRVRHNVAHSGGLPGFGSLMRWLPEYGVGIIAFGNRTYTGWGGVADEALAALAKSGGLQPRAVQPSPALTSAKASRVVADDIAGTTGSRIALLPSISFSIDRRSAARRSSRASGPSWVHVVRRTASHTSRTHSAASGCSAAIAASFAPR